MAQYYIFIFASSENEKALLEKRLLEEFGNESLEFQGFWTHEEGVKLGINRISTALFYNRDIQPQQIIIAAEDTSVLAKVRGTLAEKIAELFKPDKTDFQVRCYEKNPVWKTIFIIFDPIKLLKMLWGL
jgi:hypothetical protein